MRFCDCKFTKDEALEAGMRFLDLRSAPDFAHSQSSSDRSSRWRGRSFGEVFFFSWEFRGVQKFDQEGGRACVPAIGVFCETRTTRFGLRWGAEK